MRSFATLPLLGAFVGTALATVVSRQEKGKLTPVEVKGNAFFAGDERFYIRGVAYQPGGAADAQDPLLDLDALERDIKNFKELGINTIRVYTIDNSKNHDKGMKMLDDAGIYLALDANSPKYSLNRESPESLHASYNDNYLKSVFATIDAFADYNNLLLFFSGNEVINNRKNTNAAPYIKAVTRDMKAYIAKRHSRKIPVGYSAADVAENIQQQALYFDCGDEDVRADFFAFNDYSWCDPSDFKTAGWDKKVETYGNFSKPIFLSEFGCITNKREWNEISALYSDKMTSVYSGGLAYEYTVEKNGYGIVKVENGKIVPNDDFDRLKEAYSKQENPKDDGGYKKSGKKSQCPPVDKEWAVMGTNIPKMPEPAKKFFDSGVSKGPGLVKGDEGSQWDGVPSETKIEKIEEGDGSGSGEKETSGSDSGEKETSGSDSGEGEGNGDDTKGAAFAVEAPLRLVAMIAASAVFGSMLLL